MNRTQAYRRLLVILLLFFSLATANSMLTPLHKGPDEIAHFQYSQFIAENGRLPLNFSEREAAGYIAFWPPLYHMLVAATVGWSNQDGPPQLKLVWQSPRALMAERLLDNKRLANTLDEQWPYRGPALFWHLGRLVSVALSMGTILFTFLVVLEIVPGNYRLAVLSAAVIALLPSFIFMSSVMSYEPLLGLLCALYLWTLLKICRGADHWRYYLLLGLWMGLSVTAKYATVVLPLQPIILFGWLAWRHSWGVRGWFTRLMLTGGAAILSSGWWFLFLMLYFNEVAQYGWLVGLLKPIIAGGMDVSQNYIAALLTNNQIGTLQSLEIDNAPFSAWLIRLSQTLWTRDLLGFTGWPYAHLLLSGVGLFAFINLLIHAWLRPPRRFWTLFLLSYLLLFLLFPLLRYAIQGNVRWTAQGRHILFPVATILPLLLLYAWPRRGRRYFLLLLLGGLSSWSLAQMVRASTVYLPPLPIQTTAPAINHPLTAQFGQHLTLLGYNTALDEEALHVTLYWQAPAYVDEDYHLTTRLTPVDNPQTPLFEQTALPTNARYPTRIWEAWEVVHDRWAWPRSELPAGDYQLTLQLHGATGPLPVGTTNTLTLPPLTLPPPPTVPPPDHALSLVEDGQPRVEGISLWQPLRRLYQPYYEPRMTIPFRWFGTPPAHGQLKWLLIDPHGVPQGAARPAGPQMLYFTVGLDWPQGQYRLRVEHWNDEGQVLASTESGPLLHVENEFPRALEPPPIAHPLPRNFGNRLELLGYDLPQRVLPPGQAVPLTLYWRGLRTMGRSYTLFSKLLNTDLEAINSVERLPADYYSTIYWLPGEVVTDAFALPAPPDVPPGLYWLNIGLYDEVGQQAVSLPLLSAEGTPTGETSLTIGPVRFGGLLLPPPEVPPQEQPPVTWGEPPVLMLLGYALTPDPAGLQVTLYWESVAPTPYDWTRFLHLRNQAGETVAQQDGLAGGAAYPTGVWAAGDVLADNVLLPMADLPAGEYNLHLGLYRLDTGVRLSLPGSADNSLLLTTVPWEGSP